MPTPMSETSDIEKLQLAFAELTEKFGSIENILEAFGLAGLPTAQRYGIFFGCIVFVVTVCSVLTLLVMGGSFQRIAEQATTGKATLQADFKTREERPLLLEHLLDARERLLKENYPDRPQRKERRTKLTKMLMSEVPPIEVAELVDDNGAKSAVNTKKEIAVNMSGFKENFVTAYRKCQDKPGGGALPGKPEARFEAYARAYAGCGDYTKLSYRRSYGRLYEAVCCENHSSEEKFSAIYSKDPDVIVGKFVRLEALDASKHLVPVYAATSGDMCFYKKSYDPAEVWGFAEEGPFSSAEEMRNSFVFQHFDNEAAFALVQNLSDRILGVVKLTNDDPANLKIQLEIPLIAPSSTGTQEELEACFLLMDRLFAHGYRRIQLSIDDHHVRGSQLADRLGFTDEGVILKDMLVKEASRDSKVYGMLNSDWDKGAKNALFRKLYGASMTRYVMKYNAKEEELDDQQRVLAERKTEEKNA